MSGLEPIAALGLACSILQILEQSIKTAHIAIKVYKDGTVDELENHERDAEVLRNLADEIDQICGGSTSRSPSKINKDLLNTAAKCKDLQREIRAQIYFLTKNAKKGSISAAILVTIRISRRKRLEELLRELEKIENHMRTSLLAATFEAVHASGVQLNDLRGQLQTFFAKYEGGERDTSKLVSRVFNFVSNEASTTRTHTSTEIVKASINISAHVTSETTRNRQLLERQIESGNSRVLHNINRSKEDSAQDLRKKRLLASLRFERMNERWSQIRGAEHPETLDWVMKTEQRKGSEASWDIFPHWLRSSNSIYWISGKPGAGKSTVVSYILSSNETSESLRIWRENVVILRHFFWRPGTSMQQNTEGLLRSLAHQILESEPGAMALLLGSRNYSQKISYTDWSRSELRSLCLQLLGESTSSFCIFLDGLDELDPSEHFYDLWELLQSIQLAASGRLKLCLASRPEPDIRRYLGHYPGLRVQDLNRPDLWRFAADQLQDCLFNYLEEPGHQKSVTHAFPDAEGREWQVSVKSRLEEELVNRAEGVFLWLCLAVRRVKQSLISHRSMDEIWQEIDIMPDKIEEMYKQIWSKLETNKRDPRPTRASLYFNMCLVDKDNPGSYFLNLLLITLVSADHELHLPARENSLMHEAAALLRACRLVENNIESDCLGLLDRCVATRAGESESHYSGRPIKFILEQETQTGYDELAKYANDTTVLRFVHRSVYDFLTDTQEGQRLMGRCGFSLEEIHVKLIEGKQAIAQLFGIPCVLLLEEPSGDSKTEEMSALNTSRINLGGQTLQPRKWLFRETQSPAMDPTTAAEYPPILSPANLNRLMSQWEYLVTAGRVQGTFGCWKPKLLSPKTLTWDAEYWHEDFLLSACSDAPKYVTQQLLVRNLSQGQIGRLLLCTLCRMNHFLDSSDRIELLDALASRFEQWAHRMVLFPYLGQNRNRFNLSAVSLVTPISLLLVELVGHCRWGIEFLPVPKFQEAYSHQLKSLIGWFQYYVDRGCLMSENVLLLLLQPSATSNAVDSSSSCFGNFLTIYDCRNNDDTAQGDVICAFTFPLAHVLWHVLQAIKNGRGTASTTQSPAFQKLEKIVATPQTCPEHLPRPLMLINARVSQVRELGNLEAKSHGSSGHTYAEVTDTRDQVVFRHFISELMRNPTGFGDATLYGQLIAHLAEAYGKCRETPVGLQQHLIQAGYLRQGLAGLD